MRALPDYIRILSDAHETMTDPDTRRARAHAGIRSRVRAFVRRWTSGPRTSGPRTAHADGLATPRLRDYPWRPADRT